MISNTDLMPLPKLSQPGETQENLPDHSSHTNISLTNPSNYNIPSHPAFTDLVTQWANNTQKKCAPTLEIPESRLQR